MAVVLLQIYLLIEYYFSLHNNYLYDALFLFVFVFVLVYQVFFNEITSRDTIEALKIEDNNGEVLFYRTGEIKFKVMMSDIQSMWYEPTSFLKRRLVVQLNNHEQHSFDLPFFSRPKQNNMDQLFSQVKINV